MVLEIPNINQLPDFIILGCLRNLVFHGFHNTVINTCAKWQRIIQNNGHSEVYLNNFTDDRIWRNTSNVKPPIQYINLSRIDRNFQVILGDSSIMNHLVCLKIVKCSYFGDGGKYLPMPNLRHLKMGYGSHKVLTPYIFSSAPGLTHLVSYEMNIHIAKGICQFLPALTYLHSGEMDRKSLNLISRYFGNQLEHLFITYVDENEFTNFDFNKSMPNLVELGGIHVDINLPIGKLKQLAFNHVHGDLDISRFVDWIGIAGKNLVNICFDEVDLEIENLLPLLFELTQNVSPQLKFLSMGGLILDSDKHVVPNSTTTSNVAFEFPWSAPTIQDLQFSIYKSGSNDSCYYAKILGKCALRCPNLRSMRIHRYGENFKQAAIDDLPSDNVEVVQCSILRSLEYIRKLLRNPHLNCACAFDYP